MSEELNALLEKAADGFRDLIKERAGKFLDGRKDQADFMKERTKRMVELGIEIAKAKTDEEREALKANLETVKDALTSEAWAIAVDGSRETRDGIAAAIDFAKDVIVKALPIVLKLAKFAI